MTEIQISNEIDVKAIPLLVLNNRIRKSNSSEYLDWRKSQPLYMHYDTMIMPMYLYGAFYVSIFQTLENFLSVERKHIHTHRHQLHSSEFIRPCQIAEKKKIKQITNRYMIITARCMQTYCLLHPAAAPSSMQQRWLMNSLANIRG